MPRGFFVNELQQKGALLLRLFFGPNNILFARILFGDVKRKQMTGSGSKETEQHEDFKHGNLLCLKS